MLWIVERNKQKRGHWNDFQSNSNACSPILPGDIFNGTFPASVQQSVNRPFPASFYFSLFYKQSTINCSIKVADDWIRTRVLLYWKRLRCQVYHNPLPNHYQGAEMVSTSLKRKAANYSEETASWYAKPWVSLTSPNCNHFAQVSLMVLDLFFGPNHQC